MYSGIGGGYEKRKSIMKNDCRKCNKPTVSLDPPTVMNLFFLKCDIIYYRENKLFFVVFQSIKTDLQSQFDNY